MPPEFTETPTEGTDPTPTSEPTVEAPEPYDWHSDIHPEVKDDPIWKSTPDIKTLTKAYADATRYNVGAVKMPGKDATPEEVSAFYAKLGRPASPEAYALSDTYKESAVLQAMRPVAHSAGLTPKQWETLQEGLSRIEGEQAKSVAASRDATIEELQGEYGAAFDNNIALAQRLIRTYGGEETWEKLSTAPIGNDPGFLRMMVQVAKAMAEEELIDSGMAEPGMNKDDLLREIDTLTSSRAYLKDSDPGHEAAVARASKLFQMAYN